MEFNFNVDDVLTNIIEIVDCNTMLGHIPVGIDLYQLNNADKSQKLTYIINQMGKASAVAQNLSQPITTTSKLKFSDHHLYILKNPYGPNNQSTVVGILKVGCKTLFLYDMQNTQHEMKPLCILDFYVHESCQRRGYGRQLFEFMLKNENISPQHLAVDRPSPKFLSFLAKHYQLTDVIPQVNNYVIFHGFFRDRNDSVNSRGRKQQQFTSNYSHNSQHKTNEISVARTLSGRSLSANRLKSISAQSAEPTVKSLVKPLSNHNTPIPIDIPIGANGDRFEDPPLVKRGLSSESIKWYLNGTCNDTASVLTKPPTKSHGKPPLAPTNTYHTQGSYNNNNIANRDFVVLPNVDHNPSYPKSSKSSQSINIQSENSILLAANQLLRGRPLVDHSRLVRDMRDRINNPYNYNMGVARHYSHTKLW